MSKVAKMNEYVANLHIWNVKLHNMHWNVVGERFVAIHNFTEELYDDVFAKFDDVAEQLKIQGSQPAASVADYLKLSTMEELPVKDYSSLEVVKILKADLEQVKQLVIDIRAIADEEGDFSTVAMMEEHADAYSKHLWFIGAMLR